MKCHYNLPEAFCIGTEAAAYAAVSLSDFSEISYESELDVKLRELRQEQEDERDLLCPTM